MIGGGEAGGGPDGAGCIIVPVSHQGVPDGSRRIEAQDATCWSAVHAVVDAVDPEGLLAGGAPADEYDPEVPDLVRVVLNGAAYVG